MTVVFQADASSLQRCADKWRSNLFLGMGIWTDTGLTL